MLRKLLKSDTRGFTLIEVVIVLAIAGLIFVIVFFAVSQAQAARRDTQRKSDMNRLAAAVNQYASNNNGAVPTDAQIVAAATTYVGTDFKDPATGNDYVESDSATLAQGEYNYETDRQCGGTGSTGARTWRVTFYQERGGSSCVDSE